MLLRNMQKKREVSGGVVQWFYVFVFWFFIVLFCFVFLKWVVCVKCKCSTSV